MKGEDRHSYNIESIEVTFYVFLITACLPILSEVLYAVLYDLKLLITRIYKTYIHWKTWAKITSHFFNMQSAIWFENYTLERIFPDHRLIAFEFPNHPHNWKRKENNQLAVYVFKRKNPKSCLFLSMFPYKMCHKW